MRYEPLDDRVLIQIDEETNSQRTTGGLYLPDTAKEKPRTGHVIAVGTDEDLQSKIKPGDQVLFGKYTGDEVDLDGKKGLILSRSEILALVRE